MSKPSRASLLAFGLPPPAAASPPLLIEQVDAAQGLLFYHAGLFQLDDALELSLVRDTTTGATPSELPGGLEEGVTYYVRPATAGSFRLATAVTSFADAGVGRFRVMFDPSAALDAAIDKAWTLVLAMCTAHGGEVEAQIVTDAAASLAVRLYVAHMAAGDAEKAASYDGIALLWQETYKPLLEAYFRGVPVRGATDATPTIAEGAPRFVRLSSSATAPNFGWAAPRSTHSSRRSRCAWACSTPARRARRSAIASCGRRAMAPRSRSRTRAQARRRSRVARISGRPPCTAHPRAR